MKDIGLKAVWKRTSGMRLWPRLKVIHYELRMAWQRAWQGYDGDDVIDIYECLTTKIPVLVTVFKEKSDTLFPDMNEEETLKVLDDIIWHFENCDEDTVYFRLFSITPYQETTYHRDRYITVRKEILEHFTEGMQLLTKWAPYMWY